jgi:hypothetical protein
MAGYPFTPRPFRLEACQLLIDATPIIGFGKGDVMKFTPVGKIFDSTVGADGTTIWYSTNEPRVMLDLIVTSHSGALPILWNMLQVQLDGTAMPPTGFPFRFFDPSTGTTVTDFAIFENVPEQVYSNGDQFNRTFNILLPTAMQPGHTTLGPLNLVP